METSITEAENWRGLNAMLRYAVDLRSSLESFYHETFSPTMTWPDAMEQFTKILAKVNQLYRQVTEKKMPMLDELAVAPVSVSTDADETLAKLSQNRLTAFTVDKVPALLRTKLLPRMEAEDFELSKQAEKAGQEWDEIGLVIEQIDEFLKILRDTLHERQKDWKRKQQRFWNPDVEPIASNEQQTDFTELTAALDTGAGLRPVVVLQ